MNSDLKKYATPGGEAHQARRRDGQFWGRPPDIPHARQRPPHTPHTRALEPDLTSRRRDKFAARWAGRVVAPDAGRVVEKAKQVAQALNELLARP